MEHNLLLCTSHSDSSNLKTMDKEQYRYLEFVSYIEKWMDSGDPVMTLDYLLSACGNDIEYLKTNLEKWQLEGRIDWLKPLNTNKSSDNVVRFKSYISKNIVWK